MTDGAPVPFPDLETGLQFERLLAEVSARFINLPADQVGPEIEAAQRRVCDALDIDRSVLWQVSHEEPGTFVLTHVYQRASDPPVVRKADRSLTSSSDWTLQLPGSAPAVLGLDARAFFPKLLERLQRGETLVISKLADLPPDAAREREMLQRFGTAANVTFPLSAGGELLGALGLDMLGRERDWSEALVARLRIVAQVFGNALARKRADQALRASEERLRLAAASAGAGLWDMDLATERVWATPEAKALYGLFPDDEVDLPLLLERVHPEDREVVRSQLRQALQQRTSYTAEYRLVLPDGRLRWINARGRPLALQPSNEPDRLVGVSADITDEKHRELQLRESEARLAAAVDAAQLGFYETREGARIVFLDDRARALLGIPPEEEYRAREFWLEHLHPDDREGVLDLSRRMLEGELARVSTEYRYVRPDGSLSWLSHVSHVLERDAAGRVARNVGVFKDITERKKREEELRGALEEVRRLRDVLGQENVYLRQEVRKRLGPARLIGRSAAVQRVVDQAAQVAPTASTVLLLGETGTGKERFATFIHDLSPRRGRAMVRVNCSAIPATLIESELFGREKGAYTGALSKQIGRFELANGSTIFLDEIGELPADVQVKLLRVLQERQVERLGSPRPVPVDVRVIAASNRNLEEAVSDGAFRQDLYFRLAVFPITLPPLRERLDDLPLLVEALVEELAAVMGKRIEAVSRQSLDALAQYHWPGNVRELRNAIERALILTPGPVLRIEVPSPIPRFSQAAPAVPLSRAIEDVERDHILKVLHETGWRIRGPRGAAEVLGLKPTTLESRMARLGIQRPGNAQPQK